MTIEKFRKVKCSKKVCFNSDYFYYYNNRIKPSENRIYVFKEEIQRNIAKNESSPNDLYIYIRSGDIFVETNKNSEYSQPPLCFYEKIINEFKLDKIFIISEDLQNPVANALLKKYNNVFYHKDNLKNDISKIMNAKNLVIANSTFSITLLRLAFGLQKVYFYDFCNNIYSKEFLCYRKDYQFYVMQPSQLYRTKMKKWSNSKEQLSLMIDDACEGSKL